jgi:hypothetical protein
MNIVYCNIPIELVDELKYFFRKLKRFVGDYRIEQQDFYEMDRKILKISFYHNVEVKEGEKRLVSLEAKTNKRGSWYFTKVIS